MSKFVEKIPAITGIVLVLVSAALVLLIYVGGYEDPMLNAAGEEMTVPKFTDVVLYWTYFLFIAAVVITGIVALVNYGKSFKASPKSALNSLIPILFFVLIFVVGWYLGSGERISIIGYEGTENEGNWAQFTDMVLFSIYSLFVLVLAAIVGARVYTSLK
jgi:hypothetical protein